MAAGAIPAGPSQAVIPARDRDRDRHVPVLAPYLQCPQLLLHEPHALLGVQVVHGEGAHVLLGAW